MTNNDNDRVLGRRGAREVSQQELEQVHGSGGPPVHTDACTSVPSSTAGRTFIDCDIEQ